MISACVFITKGPYCATLSPRGRPCSTRHSTVSLPRLRSSQSCVASTCSAACSRTATGPICKPLPTKKYSMRCVALPAARGSVQRAPGASCSVQMATSASGLLAHDSGGGASGAPAPGSAPATTRTRVAWPSASTCSRRGMRSFQNMVKCGAAILLRAGRFSQTWNSSSGLGALAFSSGNISACWMPRPAVSHCTSPLPKRAAAPSESLWSISPRRTRVTVSKPRCGCTGKPGTRSPWYIEKPSWRLKSLPSARPPRAAAGTPCAPSPAG